jgi:hypothetical protein
MEHGGQHRFRVSGGEEPPLWGRREKIFLFFEETQSSEGVQKAICRTRITADAHRHLFSGKGISVQVSENVKFGASQYTPARPEIDFFHKVEPLFHGIASVR